MPFPLFPIRIQELSGKNRQLELNDSTLPREGQETNFDFDQRIKVNRYTGNAEARAQVLGVEWKPIKFGGKLEDRRMGSFRAARGLMRYMTDIAKAGRECSFDYGPIFRRVVWKSLEFKTIELEIIEYRVELEVLGDGLGVPRRVRAGTLESPSTKDAEIWAGVTLEHISTIRTDAGPGALIQATSAMNEVLNFEGLARGALDLVAIPGQLLNTELGQQALSFLASARTAMGVAQQVSRTLDWNLPQGLPVLNDILGTGLDVVTARSSMNRATVELLRLTEKVARVAGAPVSGQIYIVRAGDTLQQISSRFFGTTSRWQNIYTSNGLNSPTLVGGEQLLLEGVPRIDLAVSRQ